MKEKLKLDVFGYAGAIINLIFASFIEVLAVNTFLSFNGKDIINIILVVLLYLFVGLLALYSIIFNIKILKGNTKEKTTAVVLGFLTLSIYGSILLMISRVKTIKDINMDEIKKVKIDFLQIANDIVKFKSLYDNDVISEEEFKSIKQKLLN